MRATYTVLLQQDDFDTESAQVELQKRAFHIYLICKRPRITIDPAHFVATATQVAGVLKIQRGSTHQQVPFVLDNNTGSDAVTLKSPYPHNRFAFVGPDGAPIYWGKVGLLAHTLRMPSELLNLEVLYIGQSYGKAGSRKAPERLKSHATLQGIYAAASANFPDQEIWLVLCEFEEMLIASFDGTKQNYMTSDAEDDEHIQQVLRTPVSEQQRINFTEAALIRYFDAPYNRIYRDSFPSPAHGTYTACYDIDYNAVSVELTTEELNCQLFSEKVSPTWWHIANFPLHSRDDRVNMFAILEGDV